MKIYAVVFDDYEADYYMDEGKAQAALIDHITNPDSDWLWDVLHDSLYESDYFKEDFTAEEEESAFQKWLKSEELKEQILNDEYWDYAHIREIEVIE